MSGHGGGGGGRHGNGRRRRSEEEAPHADERWLLTYADMITLLMALFIVMWAISSVNITKFAALRQSLREAFSGTLVTGGGGVLSGGEGLLQAKGSRISNIQTPRQAPEPVLNNPHAALNAPVGSAQAEAQNLQRLAQQIQSYAQRHGLEKKIGVSVDERGVIIRLLTDKVLFDAGSADIKSPAIPLIRQVGTVIEKLGIANPIRVEGNTDSRPISTSRYRSNWELSTGRATAVLQILLGTGIRGDRFSVAGYADQRPVASNSTEYGRYLNRHVDIVVLRHDGGTEPIASIR